MDWKLMHTPMVGVHNIPILAEAQHHQKSKQHLVLHRQKSEKILTVSVHVRHGEDKVGRVCANCQPEAEKLQVSAYIKKVTAIASKFPYPSRIHQYHW